MCLLVIENDVTAPALSDEFLTGVYTRNSDGLGVMWAENDTLFFIKRLPQSAAEFIAFYRESIQGKVCAWHARMKTHGDIDHENCHPYPVFGFDGHDGAEISHPMALMHNGVLSSGNTKDKTKSDTWHYIRDVMQPLLKDHPEMFMNEALIKMLGSAIGHGNKFAIMDYTGKIAVVNKSAFTEYQGRLLSNTYAWDYYGLHPNAPKLQPYTYPRKHQAWSGGYDPKKSQPVGQQLTLPGTTKPGGKRSKRNTKGSTNSNVVSIPMASEVQEYMDAIQLNNPDVYDKVYFGEVQRLLQTNTFRDPWDLLDAWEMDECTTEDFLAVCQGRKLCSYVLNQITKRWTEDRAKNQGVTA